ncbi:MAG: cobalt-precorrin-6A reductase [Solirubrobacterales bacterium]|nr:cobalt-precorrin-6A reductase [Solirubrobacterales bacterium]
MILILGGTAEARELANHLVASRVPVTSSLAGRVARPRLPQGAVRVGGFGGPVAFAVWLRENAIAAVVDATHPFAERISASAAQACSRAGVALLRLQRPGWTERPGDNWTWVSDLSAAASLIPALGDRVLLTTGRQGLPAFRDVDGAWFLIRCVDPPDTPLRLQHRLLLSRGPYELEGELGLIDEHRINLVVTKDSGGALTEAKLDAARERGLPVIVVRRPQNLVARNVETVADAILWLRDRSHSG